MNIFRALIEAINPDMKIPECTKCGACCYAHEYRATTHPDLTRADIARLPTKYRLHVVDHPAGAKYGSLKAITRGGNTRCIALKGRVFNKVQCDIYKQRPWVCRRFEPGGPGCLYALRRAGFRV